MAASGPSSPEVRSSKSGASSEASQTEPLLKAESPPQKKRVSRPFPFNKLESTRSGSEGSSALSIPAEAVSRWLLDAEESHALQVIREVGREKGYLILQVADELHADSDGSEVELQFHPDHLEAQEKAGWSSRSQHSEEPSEGASATALPAGALHKAADSRISRSMSSSSGLEDFRRRNCSLLGAVNSPVLKFASSMYFCNEYDDMIHLDVLRIGDCSQMSEVDFTTRDLSAKANVKYLNAAGRLVFLPGQTHQKFAVKLIEDDDWAPLQEFGVELMPKGSINVCLEFGRTATVKVIDKDVFPSDKHKDEIDKNNALHVENASLMLEYFKMNFRQSGVCTATLKMLLVEQFRNLIFVVNLFAQVLLLDYVLPDSIDNSYYWLLCVVGWQLLSFAWLHFCDYRSVSWRTAGMSRMILQSALLRTFLHLDDKGGKALRQGDLEMTINVMVPELVQSGYMNTIGLTSKVGKLLMLLSFQVSSPLVFNKPFRPTGIIASMAFPVILLGFANARRAKIEGVLSTEQTCRSNLFEHVEQSGNHYRMVFGYGCQSLFVERFEGAIRAYNNAVIERLQVSTNNVYYAKWWATVLTAFYTCLGGYQVLTGSLSVGMFLANAAAINTMGDIWDGIYSNLLEIEMAVPALRKVISLMNLRTDVGKRMEFQKWCAKRTIEQMDQHAQDEGEEIFQLTLPDQLPLQVIHADKTTSEINQGSLTALMGQSGSGKASLLRVFGGVKFPGSRTLGNFYIPSHLRLVHIEVTPLLFRGTLLENLFFGCRSDMGGYHKANERGMMEHAVRVCRRLGVSERLLTSEKMGSEVANWTEALSYHELQLLSLARGLIANPNVLVLHLPTMFFDPKTAKRVLKLLREFVDQKGIEEDDKQRALRRPRTCIFSSSRAQGMEHVDNFMLCEHGRFRMVERSEVEKSPQMLTSVLQHTGRRLSTGSVFSF